MAKDSLVNMESNKTPTTTDLLGSVEKSKNTPVTMTAEKAVNEHERLIDTLKHPTRSSLKREIKEQESELCGYKNKLKRQFKKSSLLKSEAPFKVGDRVSRKGDKAVSGTITAIKPHRSGHKIKFKNDDHKPGELFHGGKGDMWHHAGYYEKELKKSPKPNYIDNLDEDFQYANSVGHFYNLSGSSQKQTHKRPDGTFYHIIPSQYSTYHVFSHDEQGENPFAHMIVDKKSFGNQVSESLVEPHMQGKGIGKALYLNALKYHKNLESDDTISHQANKVYHSLSSHPKVSAKLDSYPGEGTHKLSWKSFRKSSLLQKGSMRRLAPWNKEARQTTANMQEDLGDWQENANRTSRKNLIHQKIDDSSRKRTLHKLSSLTPTKVHPDGKRSFLLHRGMDIGEYKRAKIKGPQGLAFQHHEESSWTPNLTISGGFASDAGRDLGTPEGAHVSSWIHEDDIALMPNQHSQNSQSDQYKYEHEVIVKPRGISPLVRRDEVAKLTGVDKDDKYSHPGGKVLDNPDRMINFRQQNQKQFGGDPIARNKYILPEFKRNRFKKSQLQKGVKQRLFPVQQEQKTHRAMFGRPLTDRMYGWQKLNQPENRTALDSQIGILPPNTMKRAIIDLSKKTASRKNPQTGELEFLMHRGIGHEEKQTAIDIPSRSTAHGNHTSWTPDLKTARAFATSRNRPGKSSGLISAWIPHSAIVTIPKHWGSYLYDVSDDFLPGKNQYAHEHEVVVRPGSYNLVHNNDVKKLTGEDKHLGPGVFSLDQAINLRANPNIKRKYIAETYAKRRRQFKKSQLLAKAPIIHEQEDDFTYKTLDDNAFNEHFHKMVHEESLPNGLIHHIYQEKHSPDAIIHALSQGNPSQPVSLIAGYIEHKGPYKGYNAHLTATAPEHQGQGHGTLLKELATKRHGRMVSDATLSPAEDRSWQKLKRPDIDVKFGQRFVGDIETHPDDANEAAQDAHIATYKKPLAASEFKKSSLLQKGARGNWKKEGYKLKMNSDVNYYGTPVMHIQAVHPKHGIVGESFIENRGDHLFPHETEVHEDHQRKGLASAMYDLAERHTGSQLQPSIHDQSDDAKALWENRLNKTLAKSSIFSK